MELILYVPGDPPANRIVAAGAAGEIPVIALLLQQGVPIDAQHTHYSKRSINHALARGVGADARREAYAPPSSMFQGSSAS